MKKNFYDSSEEMLNNIDWVGEFGSLKEAQNVLADYSPNGTFDVISFQKDYPDLLTEEEAIEIAGGAVYDGNPIHQDDDSDKIWWVQWIDDHMDEYVFTIDKEHFYNVFTDYATGKVPEDVKKIFDEETDYFWDNYFFGKDKASAKLHKVQFKKKKNRDVEVYGGPGSGRYPRGSGKNPQAERRNPNGGKSKTSESVQNLISDAKKYNIEAKPVKKLDKQLTDDEIIQKVGGSEIGSASGSCMSQAITYMANKLGYDVLDQRGGESRTFFSKNYNSRKLLDSLGGVSYGSVRDEIPGSQQSKIQREIVNSIGKGEEALVIINQHASIMRRTESDQIQYLELQTNNNGWKDIKDSKELNARFGAKTTTSWDFTEYGFKKKSVATGGYVLKYDNLSNAQKNDLQEACAYINTNEENRLVKKKQ